MRVCVFVAHVHTVILCKLKLKLTHAYRMKDDEETERTTEQIREHSLPFSSESDRMSKRAH